jgi:hypothetical protein
MKNQPMNPQFTRSWRYPNMTSERSVKQLMLDPTRDLTRNFGQADVNGLFLEVEVCIQTSLNHCIF